MNRRQSRAAAMAVIAAGMMAVDLPGGIVNVNNVADPGITSALEQARGTANPHRRSALVAVAEKLTAQQLPQIPDVDPDVVLLLAKGLTGVASSTTYPFSPWADQLGGTG